MTREPLHITGGCLCGAVRYTAHSKPDCCGYCYCADCRKASGASHIPFMVFPADAITITGATHRHTSKAIGGGDAVRNFCAECGSLVFGGIVSTDTSHTVYAGSLDDPSHFTPTLAIFVKDRPDWVIPTPGLDEYQTLPE